MHQLWIWLGLHCRTSQSSRPTKETLDALAKLLKREGESAKVSIRQARKNAMDIIKRLDGEDDRKKAEKQVTTGHLKMQQRCWSLTPS